jgi:sortase (surface protein transpeptidase)
VNPRAWIAGLPRRSRTWGVTAVALVLIGSACLIVGLQVHQHPLAGPQQPLRAHRAAKATVPRAQPAAAPAKIAPLATARSTPVELTVPSISLNVSLSTLGLNADGTVQVPTDVQQPGWFRLGPTPGEIGSAVILGHVDSYAGPGVFFKLSSLVAGDVVDVGLADGVTAEFKVTSVVTYLKTDFPDNAVYTSNGNSALQLVTCGGTFDSATGHYLSNIVVYTSLTEIIPAPDAP